MEIKRKEILPGVFLNHQQVDKFKTACVSLYLLTPLEREHAFANALIPFVLRRGTQNYPDMEALSNHLDDLYGSAIEPHTKRFGEIQCVGLYSAFAESVFLPNHDTVLGEISDLLGELLLHPVMENGCFLPSYVESEKQNLADIIRSSINDKRAYALTRCIEEMCPLEEYSVGRFGKAEDADFIDNATLTEQYHTLLSTSPIELFYVGRQSESEVAGAFKNALKGLPRGEINYEIGTDIRMNAVEDEVRYYEEHMDVTQGKLVMGYRLGECMEEPDSAVLSVFNACFGSGMTSKLFVHVREEKSLCYYAYSTLDRFKGLLLVSSGIDFDKYDVTRDEIEHQLDELRQGHLTDDELRCAKRGIISDLVSLKDHPADLESYACTHTIDGNSDSIDEVVRRVENVRADQVTAVARSVVPDIIYFLRDGK